MRIGSGCAVFFTSQKHAFAARNGRKQSSALLPAISCVRVKACFDSSKNNPGGRRASAATPLRGACFSVKPPKHLSAGPIFLPPSSSKNRGPTCCHLPSFACVSFGRTRVAALRFTALGGPGPCPPPTCRNGPQRIRPLLFRPLFHTRPKKRGPRSVYVGARARFGMSAAPPSRRAPPPAPPFACAPSACPFFFAQAKKQGTRLLSRKLTPAALAAGADTAARPARYALAAARENSLPFALGS